MYIQHTHMWPHMSMYVYIHVPTITICTFFEFQKKKVEEDFSTFYIHVFMCTCTCSTSTYMYLLLLLRYKLLVQTTNKLQTTKGVYIHTLSVVPPKLSHVVQFVWHCFCLSSWTQPRLLFVYYFICSAQGLKALGDWTFVIQRVVMQHFNPIFQ